MGIGRTAVIVGYGPGVGAAVADAFAAEGYGLALIARNAAKLSRAAEALRARGLAAHDYPADVGDPDALDAALGQARRKAGDPEVLVYNAAAFRPGPTLATEPQALADDFAVSVTGALVAARAVAPAMIAARRGTLLFTGGGYALYPSPDATTLSIGKAGLRALALMLAAELGPHGVKAATVTITGAVAQGGPFAPARIAAAFVAAHNRPTKPEIVFDGQGLAGFSAD